MLNRWQRTIVDLRGNVVPYAQLQVRVEATQASALNDRDRGGTEAIPNGIVTANEQGYAYFYAPAGLYRITSAEPVIDWRDVDLGSAAAQQLAQQALDNAVPTYETLVDMQADTGQPVPTLGRVVNDSTLEDNGYYVWTGSAWERAAYQPLSDMDVSIEPAPSTIPRATGDGVIREAWVEDLPFNYDQIYAQLWSARYPGIPAPSFYQEFGGGASLLDPRITFSRSGEATYIKNGRLLTAGVDEPVFEDGGLRVWSSVTNFTRYSEDYGSWTISDAVNVSVGGESPLPNTNYARIKVDNHDTWSNFILQLYGSASQSDTFTTSFFVGDETTLEFLLVRFTTAEDENLRAKIRLSDLSVIALHSHTTSAQVWSQDVLGGRRIFVTLVGQQEVNLTQLYMHLTDGSVSTSTTL